MLKPQPQCTELNNFASFFESINPAINPNLNQCFPQPVLPTESQSSSSGKIGFSDEFEQDAVMGSDVSNDGSSGDSIVINSGGDDSMVSTALDTPGKSVDTDQPLVNNVQNMLSAEIKVAQLARCEICDIDFDSSIVYVRHISGKRHKKKSEMLNYTTGTTAAEALNAVAGQGLETKRQKLVEGSATVVFMRFCTMCDFVCNSQEMYAKHLAGKKHAAQAHNHTQNGMELSVAANPKIISRNGLAVLPQVHNTCSSESNPIKTCADQFAWCEVCSICCTSMVDLGIHKLGKNHQKNMKKSKTMTRVQLSGQMNELNLAIIDELYNQNTAASHAMVEDLETKKRKIMEGRVNGLKLFDFVSDDNIVMASPTDRMKLSDSVSDDNSVTVSPTDRMKLSDSVSDDNSVMVSPTDMKDGGCKSGPNNMGIDKFVRCDVCSIFCNSDDLVLHKLGKKHLKKLEKVKMEMNSSTPASDDALVSMVPVAEPTNGLKNENATKLHGMKEDSEKKKRKILESIRKDGEQCVSAILDSEYGTRPTVLPLENNNRRFEIEPFKINGDQIALANPEDKINKVSTNKFARCEVCGIWCTSMVDLEIHELGKNHQKNMKKSKTITRVQLFGRTNELNLDKIDELYNQNTVDSHAMIEDSETKKRKIMEGGVNGFKLSGSVFDDNSVMVSPTDRLKLSDSVSDDSNFMVSRTDMKAGGCKSDPKIIGMDKFARCDVCNVFCTSDDHLVLHKLGKKHLKKLEKVKRETNCSTPASDDAPVSMVPVGGPTNELKIENATKLYGMKEDSEKKKRKILESIRKDDGEKCVSANLDSGFETSTTVLPLESKNRRFENDPFKINGDQTVSVNPDDKTNKISINESARCEVCNIYCTSRDVLIVHNLGKKHLKKLVKIKGMEMGPTHIPRSIQCPCNLQIKQGKIVDLKKDSKMMIKPEIMEIRRVRGFFRLCTVCNVFCNSQTVLDSHLSGQNHATSMRKLGISTANSNTGHPLVQAT